MSLWLLPLVWVNQVFDVGSYLLGPSGRWWRRPAGRTLLGWLGLVLLLGAVAWVAVEAKGLTVSRNC